MPALGIETVMSPLGYTVARPFLEAATDAALGFHHQPIPSDAPRVHAPGPNADRVLLVGTGAVAGVGVASHELGLGGHLARRLSVKTGRGVDLTIDGSITMTVVEAIESFADRSLRAVDAVVLFLGSRESIGLQPMRLWKPQLTELLDTIQRADGTPHVFVVATPPIYRYSSLPSHLVERMHGHVDRQNEVTASVCAPRSGVTFIPFGEAPEGWTYQLGSTAYENWAALLAPTIAPIVTCSTRRHESAEAVDEGSRQAALDALRVVDSEVDARFDRIARTARDLLGASGASVTFLDHDRQWIKSAVSMSSGDTARAISFCNTTITRPELFVVEDTAADEFYTDHPWVAGEEHVRFYAGYPVEAPNGERIGALCVVDTKPRHFTGAEAALLRELALRVQNLLWAG